MNKRQSVRRTFKKSNVDKKAADLTMNRMIADQYDPVMEEKQNMIDETPEFVLDEAFTEKVKNYNEKVLELDPDYTNLKMLNDTIVVRVILNEPAESESGVIMKPLTSVVIKTSTGVGELYRFESPFPYSRKAVIVNVPDSVQELAPGQVVALKDHALRIDTRAQTISPANVFVHPDGPEIPPADPSDKHYGYVQVNRYELSCIV